jgi:prefoldin subunit 5
LRFEATRERLTQLYKENSAITTELARAQEKLNDAQDYYDKNVGKRAAMMGQMSPLQQKASAELVESQKQHDLLSEALDKNNGSIKAIEATLDDITNINQGNDEILIPPRKWPTRQV